MISIACSNTTDNDDNKQNAIIFQRCVWNECAYDKPGCCVTPLVGFVLEEVFDLYPLGGNSFRATMRTEGEEATTHPCAEFHVPLVHVRGDFCATNFMFLKACVRGDFCAPNFMFLKAHVQ